MKHIVFVFGCVLSMVWLSGCAQPKYMTVEFNQAKPIKYKYKAKRTLELSFQGEKGDPAKKQVTNEKLEYVLEYKALGQDVSGLQRVHAKCISANVERDSTVGSVRQRTDAVESLEGKEWEFSINPLGDISDYSQMEKVARDVSESAFSDTSKQRIKNPDMIWDFVDSQWFMWDVVSSYPNPDKGVSVGAKWDSLVSLPFVLPLKYGRGVEYELTSIEPIADQNIAHINSVYSVEEQRPDIMPDVYGDGSFMMRGTFGFLRGYKVLGFDGTGKVDYNLTNGVMLKNEQQFKIEMSALMSFPLPDVIPTINIVQSMSCELVE